MPGEYPAQSVLESLPAAMASEKTASRNRPCPRSIVPVPAIPPLSLDASIEPTDQKQALFSVEACNSRASVPPLRRATGSSRSRREKEEARANNPPPANPGMGSAFPPGNVSHRDFPVQTYSPNEESIGKRAPWAGSDAAEMPAARSTLSTALSDRVAGRNRDPANAETTVLWGLSRRLF